jgi:hypothetical protein
LGGVLKPEGFGVKGLTGQDGKAILNKLSVLGKGSSLEYVIPTITGVIEQSMTDGFHMGTNLVGSSRFQSAFYEGNIAQPFDYTVVSNRHFT